MKNAGLYIIAILFFFGCETSVEDTNTLIVRVGNEKLYLEDFQEMIPKNLSQADSAEVVNNLVDKWVKETLFMNEAKKKVDNKQSDTNSNEVTKTLKLYEDRMAKLEKDNSLLKLKLTQLETSITSIRSSMQNLETK